MATPASLAPPELRLVLETALDAVVVMNSDGIVAEWNDRAVEIFGWSAEEVIGRTMADFIIPVEFRSAHHIGLRKFLDTGVGPILRKRIEVSALRKNGEEFPVELSISPLQHEGDVIFIGCLRDISEPKRAAAQKQLLVDELNHRVRNMLAVVTGIASMTAGTSDTIDEFDKKFTARLFALSRAHSILATRNWGDTLLADLIDEILAPHAGDRRFEIEGAPVMLKAGTTLTMSLLLHELATNALKYGALSMPDGKLAILWNLDGPAKQLNLRWHESGSSQVSQPKRSGFGLKLIEASVRQDLRGDFSVAYGPTGVRYEFRFPL